MDRDGSISKGGDTASGGGSGGGDVVAGGGDGAGSGGTPIVPPGEIPGGVELKGAPAYHGIVRLTHAQWANSVTDVFGVETTELVATLHPDPPEGKFDNNEKALYIESELWGDFQRVAEGIAEQVATTPSLNSRFGGLTNSEAFMQAVAKRIFRRSLTDAERSAYQEAWALGATYYASGNDAVDGARVVLEAMLQSPHFLYRVELAEPGARLDGTQLATKLSLLLRDTLPSTEMLEIAEDGAFDSDAGLLEQTEAMLDEETALSTFNRYHTELYGLDRYKNIQKDTATFPNYTTSLNSVFLEADLRFFGKMYEEGGTFSDILTSNVAFVDAQTAPYYGLTATGNQLVEKTVGPERPGFLTRLGYLAFNATNTEPDPIHRGVDINRRMLCVDIKPPDGIVIPPLPEPKPGQTNRERVTEHTGSGSCGRCHLEVINPPGFAFENFDGMGEIRESDAGKPVDTADEYRFSDGLKSFTNASELIALLAGHPQAHGCYAAQLGEFVLGRDVAGSEETLIAKVQEASFENQASIKELVLMLIQDPHFTTAQGSAQ